MSEPELSGVSVGGKTNVAENSQLVIVTRPLLSL